MQMELSESSKKLRASKPKLESIIEPLMQSKGWSRQSSPVWWETAYTTQATLKRFWRGLTIEAGTFIAICRAVGLEDYEQVVDRTPAQQHNITYFSYNDETWTGRTSLVADLCAKIRHHKRVLFLKGFTGIGKTTLAERLVSELDDRYSCVRISFDEDEREQFGDFRSEANRLLEAVGQKILPCDRQDSQKLLDWLVAHLSNNPCLVLIDGLERILEGSTSNFKDKLWLDFFRKVMTSNHSASCVILTSQELPLDLDILGIDYPNSWHCEALSGFTPLECLELFAKHGLDISCKSEGKSYLERIGAAYEGHPLALQITAAEIASSPFMGNVVAYWKEHSKEIEEVERVRSQPDIELESSTDRFQLAQYTARLRRAVKRRIELTFERLLKDAPLSYLLLCLSAVYRRPVPKSFLLKPLVERNISEDQQETALEVLLDRCLLEEIIDQDDECLYRQHNLIRSVALKHLVRWQSS